VGGHESKESELEALDLEVKESVGTEAGLDALMFLQVVSQVSRAQH
jgi:hypothetical protein